MTASDAALTVRGTFRFYGYTPNLTWFEPLTFDVTEPMQVSADSSSVTLTSTESYLDILDRVADEGLATRPGATTEHLTSGYAFISATIRVDLVDACGEPYSVSATMRTELPMANQPLPPED